MNKKALKRRVQAFGERIEELDQELSIYINAHLRAEQSSARFARERDEARDRVVQLEEETDRQRALLEFAESRAEIVERSLRHERERGQTTVEQVRVDEAPSDFTYITGYYGVPAAMGVPVIFDGRKAEIVGVDDQQYLMIQVEGEDRPWRVHPTWRMEYPTLGDAESYEGERAVGLSE